MKLLDQSAQTNWKFIAIVAVVTLLLGGGVWWYGKMLTEADLAQEQEYAIDSTRKDEQESETSGWQTNQYTELDGKVWVDVNQITTAINLYYEETKRLPKSLDELTSLPSLSFFTLNKNPITGKFYVYTPHSDGESFVVSGTQSDGTEYIQEFSIK